jgi:hypothetical protein
MCVSVNGIIWLIESVCLGPKVIPLSGAHGIWLLVEGWGSWITGDLSAGVANLLPAGIFLPLRPFLNALQIFLELFNIFLNRKLNPNYVWPMISL